MPFVPPTREPRRRSVRSPLAVLLGAFFVTTAYSAAPSASDGGSKHASNTAALEQTYEANKDKADGAIEALRAAREVARAKRDAHDSEASQWWRHAVDSWYVLNDATWAVDGRARSRPYVDWGAEAEFSIVDEELKAKFDYETGHQRFVGLTTDIIGKFDKTGQLLEKGTWQIAAQDAQKYDKALGHIVQTYPSLEWVPTAIARQGSLYDSIGTGLSEAEPPAVKYFSPAEEELLRRLDMDGRANLADQAAHLREQVKTGWHAKKDRELAAVDHFAVRRYATAVWLARAYRVRNAMLDRALTRLGYYTGLIGDVKMGEYLADTLDPTDPKKERHMGYLAGQFVGASLQGAGGMPGANVAADAGADASSDAATP